MNSTIPPFSIRKPIHCWDNFTGGETNKTYASDILLLLASTESPDCYPHLNKEQKNNFLVYEEIVGGYCNCLVGFIGIIGNIVCLIVLCQKELQKNNCFNKLLVGLVLSDTLHIIFGIMESFRNSFSSFYPDGMLKIFPYFHYPFYRITLCASIYMVVSVAIERYLAVCFPLDYQSQRSGQKAKQRAWLYVLPAVIAALIINIPRFLETKAIQRTYWTNDCGSFEVMEVIPTPLRLQHKYIIIYVNWIWSVATGILPFIILTILNIRIFIALRKVKRNLIKHNSSNSGTKSTTQSDINIPNKIAGKRSKTMEDEIDLKNIPGRQDLITNASSKKSFVFDHRKHFKQHQHQKQQYREANMAVILVCTVTMFLICHLPRMFIVIFEASTVHKALDCREQNMLGIPIWFLYIPPIVRFLQVLNASVNFPIYYCMGTAFRNSFHRIMQRNRT